MTCKKSRFLALLKYKKNGIFYSIHLINGLIMYSIRSLPPQTGFETMAVLKKLRHWHSAI